MSVVPKKNSEKQFRENELKWGKPLIEAGFVVFPSVILEYQQRLEIDPIDMTLLLQIIKHWWEADKAPFPSRASLAACIGRDISTVQRRISRLRNKGLIEIQHRYDPETGGRTSSKFTFNGLIAKATELANEKLASREQRKQEDAAKRRRRPLSEAQLKIADTDR
jgi:predicted transcriptional regulator